MIFEKYNINEIRNICRQTIETLEYWLRNIIESELKTKFGENYFDILATNHIIKKSIVDKIKERKESEPERYTRLIDASLLDNLISVICHPNLFNDYFRKYFDYGFPEGNDELRTFLERLIDPRNRLSHSNPISNRNAEQIICYSHDVIESIKNYYLNAKMEIEFNVPRITKYLDSFGNQKIFEKDSPGDRQVDFCQDPRSFLRPNDVLSIEIEVDESFKKEEYEIKWWSEKGIPTFTNHTKITLPIESKYIGEFFLIKCEIKSNKDWHRLSGADDILLIFYRVLPK